MTTTSPWKSARNILHTSAPQTPHLARPESRDNLRKSTPTKDAQTIDRLAELMRVRPCEYTTLMSYLHADVGNRVISQLHERLLRRGRSPIRSTRR